MLTCGFSSFFNIKSEHSVRTLPALKADTLDFSLITAKYINKSYFAHVHEVESGLNSFTDTRRKKNKSKYSGTA